MPPDPVTLIVVAHPDDEVLGFGGTAGLLAERGRRVVPCILVGGAEARTRRPADEELNADTLAAARILGMEPPILGPFPNIQLNAVPHLDLVQFIEQAIESVDPAHIVTHHLGDLNDDHRQVARATHAAARLSQRRGNKTSLKSLHAMEVPSSTDWSFGGVDVEFRPTSFFEIGRRGLDLKQKALACYRDVMRPYPHPRSVEVVEAWAVMRGAQAGLEMAESFQALYVDLGDVL